MHIRIQDVFAKQGIKGISQLIQRNQNQLPCCQRLLLLLRRSCPSYPLRLPKMSMRICFSGSNPILMPMVLGVACERGTNEENKTAVQSFQSSSHHLHPRLPISTPLPQELVLSFQGVIVNPSCGFLFIQRIGWPLGAKFMCQSLAFRPVMAHLLEGCAMSVAYSFRDAIPKGRSKVKNSCQDLAKPPRCFVTRCKIRQARSLMPRKRLATYVWQAGKKIVVLGSSTFLIIWPEHSLRKISAELP